MKFAIFLNDDNKEEIGIVKDSKIFSLKEMNNDMPNNMMEVINKWPKIGVEIKKIILDDKKAKSLKDVKIKLPIKNPKKIFAHGLNYADHIIETGIERPQNQLWFSKHINALNGPYELVELPEASNKTDYEVELIVIIGKS